MRKSSINFGEETLIVPFPKSFYHKGPGDDKERVITAARVRRLYGPDLTAIKRALRYMSTVSDLSGYAFMTVMKELMDLAVEAYYDSEKVEVTNAPLKLLNGKAPPQTTYKLILWIIMLTKETSYVATNYKCDVQRCNKSTLFDLDPDVEVPKGIEADRTFMEDLMDFYSDKVDRKHTKTFEYNLKSPMTLESLEEAPAVAEGEPEPLTPTIKVFKLKLNWPGLIDYITSFEDESRQDDPELWVIFDCIISINDLTEQETKELKAKNGFTKVMRMKIPDLQGLIKELNTFGVEIDHKWTCVHCGKQHTNDPFDFTNFYASLTNTK